MTQRFVIADPHFGHENAIKWRPQFSSVHEMNNHIIENWNRVVLKDDDIVWILGDVCWTKESFDILYQLKGRKKIILGNHDTFPMELYMQHAETVLGAAEVKVRNAAKVIMTHIPVHPQQVSCRYDLNLHGHLHSEKIEKDSRYICVSCEHIDYTPINLDELVRSHQSHAA